MSLHFAWKCALCIIVFVLFISMQVVHYVQYISMILSSLVLVIKDVMHIRASVLLAFQHMECLLLIYFCICYCC